MSRLKVGQPISALCMPSCCAIKIQISEELKTMILPFFFFFFCSILIVANFISCHFLFTPSIDLVFFASLQYGLVKLGKLYRFFAVEISTAVESAFDF